MSSRPLQPRARAVVLIVPLFAALACASQSAPETSAAPQRAPGDTLNTVGKSTADLFAGKFPGVIVTQGSGGGFRVAIRGNGDMLYGQDEPLIVVDGTPLPAGTGGLIMMNPNDIQNIEVLKNPADIAVYGIRGGSGVIRITTRRPSGH